jgi:hypothetical protein
MAEHSDFLDRARGFLSAEAKALDKEPELDLEGAARVRLLATWTGQLVRHEAVRGAVDPLDLDEMIEELEEELDALRAARDDALVAEAERYAYDGAEE